MRLVLIIDFGIVALSFTVTGGASIMQAAVASTMYEAEHIVGTLLEAEKMYESSEVIQYESTLRIDEGSGELLREGETWKLHYHIPASEAESAPDVGQQVRIQVGDNIPKAGDDSPWELKTAPQVIGRGEFVRPGQGASIELGSENAKILVKMFAPLITGCHRETVELLKEFSKREPERVRIQIFDMGYPKGRAEATREKLTCATVLVNNRLEFTIAGPEKERKVALYRRPGSARATYESEDVITVIEQELQRIYGTEAES